MPFDWMESRVPASFRKQLAGRAREGQEREITDRATLLHHLGRTAAYAAERCRDNLRWEHELHGEPKVLSAVKKLVDAAYRRS